MQDNRSVVGYARVSTLEQADTDALEQQMSRLKNKGISEIFVDIQSGRSNTRKEFNKLIKLCEENKIKEIIITRIDRLARSVITISKTLNTFEKFKVKLTILDAPIDASSPFGWFSINQMAGLAEFESRLLSDRIKHGYNFAREQVKANSNVPFGYIRFEEKYVIDTSKVEIINEIINYFLSPKGTLRNTSIYINNKYGTSFSATTMQRLLCNEVLQGHTRYNVANNRSKLNKHKYDIRYNTHEALINKDTFKLIENKLEFNRTKWGVNSSDKKENNYPLSGKIICGYCECKCYLKYKSQRIRCYKRDQQGEQFCSNKNSTKLNIIINKVNLRLIEKALELKDLTLISLSEKQTNNNPELKELYKQLNTLNNLSNKELIQPAIDNILIKINELETANNLTNKIDSELVDVLIKCFSDIDFWNTLTNLEQIITYSKLVNLVKVFDGEVIEIILNI